MSRDSPNTSTSTPRSTMVGDARANTTRRPRSPSCSHPRDAAFSFGHLIGAQREPRRQARRARVASLDHLIGKGKHARGNREAKGLRGLEVDDELESGRLQDRQAGRLLTLENSGGIITE